MKIIAAFTVAIGFLSSYASAQETDFYMGAGLGRSVAGFNSNDFDAVSIGSVKSTATSDTGYKLFGGYNFNEKWALEAGYADLGRFAYKWQALGTGPGAGLYYNIIYSFDYKSTAWFAAVKRALPVTGQLSVFGKLGLTVNKAEDTFAMDRSRHIEPSLVACLPGMGVCYPPYSTSPIFSKPGSYTKTRADVLIGVGLEYKVLKNASIRFEYEDFGRFGDSENTGRTRVTATALTFVYHF